MFVEFKYNDQLKNGIKEAIKGYGEVCNSLDVNVLEEEGLNRRTCKVAAVNADAIMQLAFQVWYTYFFCKAPRTFSDKKMCNCFFFNIVFVGCLLQAFWGQICGNI